MTRGGGRVHDKKVKEGRWTKEGRYLIALAHEGTMRSGSPPLIGSTMDLGCAESVALALTHANSSASSQGLNPVSCAPAA